jgi:hypothetical protein
MSRDDDQLGQINQAQKEKREKRARCLMERAAPDMLAALKELCQQERIANRISPALRRAEAAIAKAEGRAANFHPNCYLGYPY